MHPLTLLILHSLLPSAALQATVKDQRKRASARGQPGLPHLGKHEASKGSLGQGGK